MIEETVRSVLEAEEKAKEEQNAAKEKAAALLEEAKEAALAAVTEAKEKAAGILAEAEKTAKEEGEAYAAQEEEKAQRDISVMKLLAANNESVAVETILQALFNE